MSAELKPSRESQWLSRRLTENNQSLLFGVGGELVIGVARIEAVVDDVANASQNGEISQAPGPSEDTELALLDRSGGGRVCIRSPELARKKLTWLYLGGRCC